MNKKVFSALASLAVISALSVTPSQAAVTPWAVSAFCKQHSSECAGGGSSSVQVTPVLVSLLKSVNSRVNRSIRYRAEGIDQWTLNPARGDCEDYALSKRSALIKAGVSPNALRIGVTKTRRGEPHAVLIVRTSQGSYVLDNRTGAIRGLADTEYRIESMSTGSLMRWTRG